MSHRIWIFLALFALFLTNVSAFAVSDLVLYIGLDGNDAWSGSLTTPNDEKSDGPLKTFARAQELVRGLDRSSDFRGARIYVRGGDYYLDAPITFSAADSGTLEWPIAWSSYEGEKVRLLGGKKVEGWSVHRDKIQVATLPPAIGEKGVKQLFENSQRQTLARWPNKNEAGMPGGDWAFIGAESTDANKKSFVYANDRLKGWGAISGLEVSIWPNYNWWQTIAPVDSLNAETGVVQLVAELPYEIKPGRRFFFQNLLSELDAPGEWYAGGGKVYFWPIGEIPGEVIIPTLDHVLVMQDTKYVKFIGFGVEVCRDHGVVLKNTEECLIGKCVIGNTGGQGVHVEGGKFAQVVGNDISSTGQGGVYLEGGDRKTLTGSGHQALNNHIQRFGELFQTYHTGVQVAGVGQRVAHNLIHNGPHIGILLAGNDNVIEYNDVYDVCQQGSDNGAFYMGRDWTQRGNVLRFNKFHDVYGFGLGNLDTNAEGSYEYESPHQAWGIYLDDCSSGTEIHGNILYRIPLCGVMIGGGRDNIITNNIFFNCIPALHIDDRWDEYPWDLMNERLEAMNYKQPPYSERYPELLNMGDDPRRPANNRFESNLIEYEPDNFRGLSTTSDNKGSAVVYHFDQFDPQSTIIRRNIVWHSDQPVRIFWSEYKKEGSELIEWETWRERGFDEKSYVQPPSFMEVKMDEFLLLRDAPEVNLPFKQVPWLKYGMYKDELRASWPPPKQEQRVLPERKSWAVRGNS